MSINDKDYSITFGLYFSVEWVEPRLNLSQDVWGAGSGVGDTLVPGGCEIWLGEVSNTGGSLRNTIKKQI